MENKLSPGKNKFKEWAKFLYKHDYSLWGGSVYEADFIPKKRDDQNDDDYLKSVIQLMFQNLDKKVTIYSQDQNVPISKNQPDAYSGTCSKVLAESCGFIRQKPDYWQTFPNMYIFKVVLGFISVISWVGIGYFVNAILLRGSKRKFLLNIFAGIFDTAACLFIIYSLVVGAPLFSVPMILAGIVSFVLRIVFAIRIGKNISETKRKKQEFEYDKAIFDKIANFLEMNRPLEPEYEKEKKKKKNKLRLAE